MSTRGIVDAGSERIPKSVNGKKNGHANGVPINGAQAPQLRPFFGYYGGKWRDALKHYPEPDHETIVEPFAGSAGFSLRYAHRKIILCEIDPEWTWEPVAWIDGRPATHVTVGKMRLRDGTVRETTFTSMWGRLTLCGVTRPAVGSVEGHKGELDKELVSDFLRNAAMRFGISLALWAKGKPKAVRR